MLATTKNTTTPEDIINAANLADTTKAQYTREIEKMIDAGIDPLNLPALEAYAAALPASSTAFLSAALKILFKDYERRLKASAHPDNLPKVQAALLRIEAMKTTVKTRKEKGTKTHTWLTPDEVKELTRLPSPTLRGRRDWIVLVLLLHGLRRSEAANLTAEGLKLTPTKNGRIPVLEFVGKGGKSRVVKTQPAIYEFITAWLKDIGAGPKDKILRSINNAGAVQEDISDRALTNVVRYYGNQLGIELAPHDLRRTYAMNAWNETHNIYLVMTRLGHADPKTTIRYLNIDLDLDQDESNFVPIGGPQ